MLRAAASVTALAMLLWVLPLGNFIKPSQETTACGGGRAFHMCSMMGKARPISPSGKIAFTDASGAAKTQKPAGGSAGNDLIGIGGKAIACDPVSRSADLLFILPLQSVFFSIDPVPKV